uniref:Uncharacterized protein n=1 Tax=Anguilla anguilla TaxID=7936 RepID=A0A0E9U0J6_ANGAN
MHSYHNPPEQKEKVHGIWKSGETLVAGIPWPDEPSQTW